METHLGPTSKPPPEWGLEPEVERLSTWAVSQQAEFRGIRYYRDFETFGTSKPRITTHERSHLAEGSGICSNSQGDNAEAQPQFSMV